MCCCFPTTAFTLLCSLPLSLGSEPNQTLLERYSSARVDVVGGSTAKVERHHGVHIAPFVDIHSTDPFK